VRDLGIRGTGRCLACNLTVSMHLVRVRSWAVVLLIPFPYKTAYYVRCPVCGSRQPLPADGDIAAKRMFDHRKGDGIDGMNMKGTYAPTCAS